MWICLLLQPLIGYDIFDEQKTVKEIGSRKLVSFINLEWQPFNKVEFIFASNIAILVGWDKMMTQMVIKCLKQICYAAWISTIKFKNMWSVANLLVYSWWNGNSYISACHEYFRIQKKFTLENYIINRVLYILYLQRI